MQTRQKLEPLAAALVATHASTDARAQMKACAADMTICAGTGDLEGFLVADKVFDELMEEACPNRFLTAALAPLQTHARRIWFASASAEKMSGSVRRHVSVIEAIERADGHAASTAMSALMEYLSDA
jgi:DNA-binding GntR family transcriptional regulator